MLTPAAAHNSRTWPAPACCTGSGCAGGGAAPARASTCAPPARWLPGLINDLQLVVIDGGPHAIPWTHAGQVNAALLNFIGAHAAAPAR
jgi:hypothetical protein